MDRQEAWDTVDPAFLVLRETWECLECPECPVNRVPLEHPGVEEDTRGEDLDLPVCPHKINTVIQDLSRTSWSTWYDGQPRITSVRRWSAWSSWTSRTRWKSWLQGSRWSTWRGEIINLLSAHRILDLITKCLRITVMSSISVGKRRRTWRGRCVLPLSEKEHKRSQDS